MRGWRVMGVMACAVMLMAAECCDARHGALEEKQKADAKDIQLCRDRGGIPITESVEESGGGIHSFTVLKRCEWPPVAPRLQGEK